jgi:sirohydrochlorin ferrochelatase
MPNAVIVAHGQPSDPEPAEAALAAYAAEVNGMCGGVNVTSATLAAPSRLEHCLDNLPDDTVIYPLFMAKGWFVTSALPKRLGERELRILDPLGVDKALPAIAAEAIGSAIHTNTWSTDQCNLVLAAHGSGRSRNPSAVANQFAELVSERIKLKSIRVGFVEEAPSISEAAANSGQIALCLPFFACRGGHVLEDVPQELEQAGFQGEVMPVIGELPGVKRHISAVLAQAFEKV